eukprot:2487353-Pleurochrysis_carterae.AAC.6
MARSATPLSSWTYGGHVVVCTPESARKSAKRVERNYPALSEWIVPTSRFGSALFWLRSAAKDARNLRTKAGASDFVRRGYAALKREWSSTRTTTY